MKGARAGACCRLAGHSFSVRCLLCTTTLYRCCSRRLLGTIWCRGQGYEPSSWLRRAIKFKEDLDPELKAILERRPSAAQALLAPSEASYPPPSIGSQLLTAVPRRRTAEVLLVLACSLALWPGYCCMPKGSAACLSMRI